jgi:hypothetical protein
MSETIDSLQNDNEVYICYFNRNNHESDEENDQLDSDLKEKVKGKSKKKASDTRKESTYDLSENFIPFEHTYSLHEAYANLSNKDLELEIQPYFIFHKFFSSQQMETIVDNTNIYAYVHGVKEGKSNLAGEDRNWTELNIQELKIWLALVIYMGIFKFPAIEDYWKKDIYYPSHEITKLMTLFRFQQISYFFLIVLI